MKNTQLSTIELLTKRVVAVPPILIKVFGSAKLAIMWSQIAYWKDKTNDKDGWIYKTQVEMYEETGLTRKEQDKAREIGRKLEVLEDKVMGTPPKIHYRVNLEKTVELIEKYLSESNTQSLFPVEDAPEKTPGQIAIDFFNTGNGSSIRMDIANEIVDASGGNLDVIIAEMKKFIIYWTEPNKSGTKVRWQLEKTFDVKRRIYTWLSRAKIINEKTSGNSGAGREV